jgi:ribulose-phosphate 3-epimerase
VPWREWIRTVEIEPSLYAADFSHLGEQVDVLLRTGARVFHFDVGDGHFVPPITMGPVVLKWIAPIIHEQDGKVDCHLMVDNPERHFAEFAQAGGNSVTVHFEATDDPQAVAAVAREHGLEVGLAFNPQTSPEDVAKAAEGFDLINCMSVQPGYSGQEFMPEAVERVRRLRELIPRDVHVQVDGGLGPDNIKQLYDAGADLLVAGTSIFAREDLPRAYRRLVQALA